MLFIPILYTLKNLCSSFPGLALPGSCQPVSSASFIGLFFDLQFIVLFPSIFFFHLALSVDRNVFGEKSPVLGAWQTPTLI